MTGVHLIHEVPSIDDLSKSGFAEEEQSWAAVGSKLQEMRGRGRIGKDLLPNCYSDSLSQHLYWHFELPLRQWWGSRLHLNTMKLMRFKLPEPSLVPAAANAVRSLATWSMVCEWAWPCPRDCQVCRISEPIQTYWILNGSTFYQVPQMFIGPLRFEKELLLGIPG